MGAQAFYLPNTDRRNLFVLVSAHVSQILTEKAQTGQLRATGVEFTFGGGKYITHARKEVLVTAG